MPWWLFGYALYIMLYIISTHFSDVIYMLIIVLKGNIVILVIVTNFYLNLILENVSKYSILIGLTYFVFLNSIFYIFRNKLSTLYQVYIHFTINKKHTQPWIVFDLRTLCSMFQFIYKILTCVSCVNENDDGLYIL